MTRQNRIHKYIRECEQQRKKYLRYIDKHLRFGRKRTISGRNRKWWNAFNKRKIAEYRKEVE